MFVNGKGSKLEEGKNDEGQKGRTIGRNVKT